MTFYTFVNTTTAEAPEVNENLAIIQGVYTAFEQETLSVTTTSASVSYSEEMDTHLIKNIGSTTCYINFDATATTSDYELLPGKALAIDTNATAIHAITASGTTTLRIIGQN